MIGYNKLIKPKLTQCASLLFLNKTPSPRCPFARKATRTFLLTSRKPSLKTVWESRKPPPWWCRCSRTQSLRVCNCSPRRGLSSTICCYPASSTRAARFCSCRTRIRSFRLQPWTSRLWAPKNLRRTWWPSHKTFQQPSQLQQALASPFPDHLSSRFCQRLCRDICEDMYLVCFWIWSSEPWGWRPEPVRCTSESWSLAFR